MINLLKKFLKSSPSGTRKYYELWGDIVAQNYTLRILIVGCLIVVIVLVSSLVTVVRRPPPVIRVSEVGKAEVIRDIRSNNEPDEVEIRAFVREFLHSYMELDSTTIIPDMTRALNMMTREYQKVHQEELKKQNLIRKIREAGIKTRLEIISIGIRQEGSKVYATATGISRVYPVTGEGEKKANGFRSHLVLRKVPRTEFIPNGLLVDQFQNETVDLEDLKNPDPELKTLESQLKESK